MSIPRYRHFTKICRTWGEPVARDADCCILMVDDAWTALGRSEVNGRYCLGLCPSARGCGFRALWIVGHYGRCSAAIARPAAPPTRPGVRARERLSSERRPDNSRRTLCPGISLAERTTSSKVSTGLEPRGSESQQDGRCRQTLTYYCFRLSLPRLALGAPSRCRVQLT